MKKSTCEDLETVSAKELLSDILDLLASDVYCDDCKLEIIMEWLEEYYE